MGQQLSTHFQSQNVSIMNIEFKHIYTHLHTVHAHIRGEKNKEKKQ